jgi:hypothetical protein
VLPGLLLLLLLLLMGTPRAPATSSRGFTAPPLSLQGSRCLLPHADAPCRVRLRVEEGVIGEEGRGATGRGGGGDAALGLHARFNDAPAAGRGGEGQVKFGPGVGVQGGLLLRADLSARSDDPSRPLTRRRWETRDCRGRGGGGGEGGKGGRAGMWYRSTTHYCWLPLACMCPEHRYGPPAPPP